MDTKDTIDVLKYHFNIKMGVMKSVIKLLEEGEKYKQMWKELEKEKCLLIDFDDEGYFKGQRKLDEIRQKYFPKEAKQDYPESEE